MFQKTRRTLKTHLIQKSLMFRKTRRILKTLKIHLIRKSQMFQRSL